MSAPRATSGPFAPPSGVPPDRKVVGSLFRALAPRYDRVLLAYSLGQDLRWKEVLVRGLRPVPGEHALDVACGTGLILDRLAKALGASAVVGVDANRAMLLASTHAGRAHPVLQANAEALPLADEAFDLVTAGYLLKYVRLDGFFREVARVLRPGGRFGGYDFSRPMHGTALGTLYAAYLHRVLPRMGRGGAPAPGDWREVFEFLSNLAESSGWEFRVAGALEGAGLTVREIRPSLGGAITWVWAAKRSNPPR
jgi:demethylmenaquinone methyltransferase / 2-methoxy-6-polyprenyl-1,4-benzoquinol methylase